MFFLVIRKLICFFLILKHIAMNFYIFKKKCNIKKKYISLREKKHQANSKLSNGLYFQIGLIASLFLVFVAFQLQFDKKEKFFPPLVVNDFVEVDSKVYDYVIEEDLNKKVVKTAKIKPSESYDYLKVIDNEVPLVETFIESPVVLDDVPVSVDDVVVVESRTEVDTLPVSLVSDYPVYPGCNELENRKSKFKCFQQKIAKHIKRKFNSDVAMENGLTGVQKINIAFTINHLGKVVDIKARAPHPALQKEAIKAIASLPTMKPARQGFKKVNVTYALPLVFKVD
jgi:periplasmic protein TonB